MGATVSNVLEKIVPMLLVILSSSFVFMRVRGLGRPWQVKVLSGPWRVAPQKIIIGWIAVRRGGGGGVGKHRH